MDNTIITRFPPSPTGFLHVGGARTALFNWLHARKSGGKFVLRIEDTDIARSTQEAVDAIFEGLEWLGIDWDEGPFYQTKRFDIYKEYLDRLVADGKAYYCTCTAEEVDAMREKAKAEGNKPMYNGCCREKNLPAQEGAVVRLKTPETGSTVIHDLVKGPIAIANTEIDDFILQRSDGVYTYNFAVVIDDLTMKINPVLRGDDHVSNTPKQILIYEALGAEVPSFGHVPMVLGPDKTKLSKRHGAMSVTEYRTMGFLPEALINYLIRLGWSHGDQEFFTVDELKTIFNVKSIGKSPSVFDFDKLTALNAEHIQKASEERLMGPFLDQLAARGVTFDAEDARIPSIIRILKPRAKTLVEMAEQAEVFFADFEAYEEKAAKKNLKAEAIPVLEGLLGKLEAATDWSEEAIDTLLAAYAEESGLKFGKIGGPLRVALTGRGQSPGMGEVVPALGRDRVLPRIGRAIDWLKSKA